MHGGVAVSTFTSQREAPRSNPSRDVAVWSWHVLPIPVPSVSGQSDFLSQSKTLFHWFLSDSVSRCDCVVF